MGARWAQSVACLELWETCTEGEARGQVEAGEKRERDRLGTFIWLYKRMDPTTTRGQMYQAIKHNQYDEAPSLFLQNKDNGLQVGLR